MENSLSLMNFRDIGGLPIQHGLRLRRGFIYRGEGPARLSASQLQAVRALGLRLACDLRSPAERAACAYAIDASAQRIDFDIPNDFASQDSLGWRMLVRDSSATGAVVAMSASYTTIPAALLPKLGEFVTTLLDGGAPVLIHCTAGKDRTGVLVALLLLYLGCPLDAVEHDYLQSAKFGHTLLADPTVAPRVAAALGAPVGMDALRALVGVDLRYLKAALGQVETQWGAVEGYFAAAGLDEHHRHRLMRCLGESAAVA